MPKFLTILGPQAVGKMTVGQELSRIIDYKLFYNHMTIEFIRLIFDYDKQVFNKMNAEIRELIFKQFAQSKEKGIIFTGCFDFGKDLEKCMEQMKEWTKGYEEIYVVELQASLEERLRRNKTENRLQHKASKRDLQWSENELLKSMEKHQYNSIEGQGEKLFKNYIKIDNTNLSAEEVAKIIKDTFNL
ncbi:MAG: AAA family ATPase [Clostridia bacterium]|nr:AAA family ATPase [Clostridia bacterium]